MANFAPLLMLTFVAAAAVVDAFVISETSRAMLPKPIATVTSMNQSQCQHKATSIFARRRNSREYFDGDDEDFEDDFIDAVINEKIDGVVEEEDFASEIDNDDDSREKEFARVGTRRRGRGRFEEEQVSSGSGRSGGDSKSSGDGGFRFSGDIDYEDADRSRSRRRGARYEDDEYDDSFDDEFEDDYDDEDYEEDYSDEEEEEDEFEEGILVPNPILDAVDPEGAAERIGELFVDPKFWRDAGVIAALCWAVYLYTFDAGDMIPWDSVKPDDFDLKGLYQPPPFPGTSS